jgi:hypothetical protein
MCDRYIKLCLKDVEGYDRELKWLMIMSCEQYMKPSGSIKGQTFLK